MGLVVKSMHGNLRNPSFRNTLAALFALATVAGLVAATLPLASQPSAPPAALASPETDPGSGPSAISIPAFFEANVGQANADTLFLTRAAGATVELLPDGLRLDGPDGPGQVTFVGASMPRVQGDDAAASFTSYFQTGLAKDWLRAPHYGKVVYEGLYPGIDVVFYADAEGVPEFDYVVAPGADVRAIRLSSSDGLRIDDHGDLVAGGLRLRAPTVYQDTHNGRIVVDSRYALATDGSATFQLGAFDTARALIIDPKVTYSSYVGGTGTDSFMASKGNLEGGTWFLYATGSFSSSASTRCSPQATCPAALGSTGGGTGAIAKFNLDVDGNPSLQWIAMIPGTLSPLAIDADASRVYITGFATALTGPSPNAYAVSRTTSAGMCSPASNAADAFVTVITNDGQTQVYNSFIGGDADDAGTGITVQGGRPVITGYTQWVSSKTFPWKDGFQPNHAGPPRTTGTICLGINVGGYDAFLARIDPDAAPVSTTTGNPQSLVWSTFVGGGTTTTSTTLGADYGNDVVFDAAGDLWMAGRTSTQNSGTPTFPLTPNAEQPTHGGGTFDAFLVKVSGNGRNLQYGSYFGGPDTETGMGVALGNGRVHLVGGTNSGSGFRFNGPAYGTSGLGGTDAYVAAFTLSPVSLVKSTLIGTSSTDELRSVQVDANGDVAAQGYTGSGSNFPAMHTWPNLHGGNNQDLVAVRFDSDLQTLEFSTAIGGTGAETIPQHAGTLVGTAGGPAVEIVVAGGSTGSWPIANSASNTGVPLPALNSYHRTMSGSSRNGVIAKFSSPSEPYVKCGLASAAPYRRVSPITFTWAPTGFPHTQGIDTYTPPDANWGMNIASFQWDFDYNGVTFVPNAAANGQVTPAYSYPASTALGAHTVMVRASDTAGNQGSGTCSVTLVNTLPTAACSATSTPPFMVNVPVTFSSASSVDPDGTITAYEWNFPSGTPATSTAASPTVTWSAPGTYSVTLRVTDNNGGVSSWATCATTIMGDPPPVARNDPQGVVVGTFTTYYQAGEDTALVLAGTTAVGSPYTACGTQSGVLCNDDDNGPLTAIVVYDTGWRSTPQGGNAYVGDNGNMTYIGPPGFCGTDSFTYRATDGNGPSGTATAYVLVSCLPDLPTAVPDAYAVASSSAVLNAASVKLNDFDPDPAPPAWQLAADIVEVTRMPGHAQTFVMNADGTFTYQSNGFVGTDYFWYRLYDPGADGYSNMVNVTIVISPSAPFAVDDPTPTTTYVMVHDEVYRNWLEGTPNLLANDGDPDAGDRLSVDGAPATFTTAMGRQVLVQPDGRFEYRAGSAGVDSFTYRVRDLSGLVSAPATVRLEILPNQPPEAAMDQSTLETVAGRAVSFTDLSTDDEGITCRSWEFGDGGTSTEADPIHVYDMPGTYVVRLNVCDAWGYTDFVTVTVRVLPRPATPPEDSGAAGVPVANAGADLSTVTGRLVTLEGSTKTPNAKFQWRQIGGDPEVALQNATRANASFVAPPVRGVESVTLSFELRVIDGSLVSPPDYVNVVVHSGNRAPSAIAGAVQTATDGDLVTLNASASLDPDGDGLTFSWTQTQGPPVQLSATDKPLATFTVPAGSEGLEFAFALRVSDGIALAQDTARVLVLAKPGSGPVILHNVTLGNASFLVRLPADSYTWDFGDGSNATGGLAAAWHNYTASGDYTVKVVLHSASGSRTFTERITVELPEPEPAPSTEKSRDTTGTVDEAPKRPWLPAMAGGIGVILVLGTLVALIVATMIQRRK